MRKIKEIFVLGIGVITIPSGRTQYGWSIYDDHGVGSVGSVFLTDRGFLLYCTPNTFEIGDEIETMRGNDSHKKLVENVKIIDHASCKAEEVIEMLFRNGYDYKPKRAFQKSKFKRKLSTSYSVK